MGSIEDMSPEEIRNLPENMAYMLARQANADLNGYYKDNEVEQKPYDVLLHYKAIKQGVVR